jgi:restriction system protein
VVPALFRNHFLAPLLGLARELGLILVAVFGVIALVKYLRARAKNASNTDNVFDIGSAKTPSEQPQSQDIPPRPLSKLETELARAQNPIPRQKPTAWSLEVLQSIEWKRFEELVAAYFREKGFECKTVTHGPDGGIDATIYQDGKRIALVQCKAWNTKLVGVKPIRELLGVMVHEGINKGYFMITGEFSQDALDFCKTHPITLASGKSLLRAIGRTDIQRQQRLLDVATEGDYTTPTCPSCGVKMVTRTNNKFWGCINYPRCHSKILISSS